ncbi:MAG TPA: ABC transporter permease [Vicinamibacterales bacterium]|nr:ABC transporter permease [Vicinamibacterales bacterium]
MPRPHIGRRLRQSPTSSLITVVTVSIGIGAAVSMFSVFDAVVLTPMSIERPHEVVGIGAVNPKVRNVPTALSWVRFDNSLRQARSFVHIAAYDNDSATVVAAGAAAEQLPIYRVSAGFFPALGVRPQAGRLFTDADDQAHGPAVCVLSHEFWQSRFAGEAVVGRTMTLAGRTTEIIGVLPPRLTPPWTEIPIFVPRVFESSTVRADNVQNGASFLAVLGRLRSDVTIEQAQHELDSLGAEYAQRFAGRMDAANSTRAIPFVQTLIGNRRQTLIILLVAVGAVLLVSCTNASALFLGRLMARHRETAICQALGASRWRIVRDCLFESLGLSLAAALAGLAVAWALLRLAASWFGPSLPSGTSFEIDARVLAVTLAVMLVSALIVGLVPALYVSRPARTPLLGFSRDGATGPVGRRLRSALVFAEVTLSCMLLVGAALLAQSLTRLQRASPGFDARSTAAGLISLPAEKYPTSERQAAFVVEAVDRLKRAPNVLDAAAVFGLPLGDEFTFHQYVVAGRPIPPPSERERAGIRLVTEGYFKLMGIRLKSGRLFTELDREGATLVCIINESLARRMFDGDPIGQSVLRGRDADLRYEIIGVVEDVRTYGLRQDAVDEIFYPIRQLPWPHFALIAKSDGDPIALRRPMEQAVSAVDSTQPLARFATMGQRLDATWGTERAMAGLTTLFAAVAVFMSVIGLYAALAHTVAARTVEIGLRMALGSDRLGVIRLILLRGLLPAGAGIVCGLFGAALSARYLASELYAVSPIDPFVYTGVAVIFLAVAAGACLVPSWRASRLDPLTVLKLS